MNIQEILEYYAFNNREFPQEFENYLEELPSETYEQVQRQLTRIRISRRRLEVLRRQHSELQTGSEQDREIREALRLTNVDIHNIIDAILVNIRPATQSREIQITTEIEDQNTLHQLSYETLVKQLYGLPVVLPQFLIVNGLKLEFIPFSQLNSIKIERYLIEPLLQPWASTPYGVETSNRILTIFDKNGMTYLVKAKYDGYQIFPPV